MIVSNAMRLINAAIEFVLAAPNREFTDNILEGRIKAIEPAPEEIAHENTLALARVVALFKRRDYGRLGN